MSDTNEINKSVLALRNRMSILDKVTVDMIEAVVTPSIRANVVFQAELKQANEKL